MSGLSRREFVVGAGAGSVGWAVLVVLVACRNSSVQAQQPRHVHRVGLLWASSADDVSRARFAVFREGMQQYGYVEGQNITFEGRFADGDNARVPDLAADLVNHDVGLIIALGGVAARAASSVTGTIPILVVGGDPVGTGLAASYARPGGNITGLTTSFEHISGKRLQLLKDTIPGLTRVSVLLNSAQPAAPQVMDVQSAAQTLGLQLQLLDVREAEHLDGAFEAAGRERAEALLLLNLNFFVVHQARIITLAAQHRLTVLYGLRSAVQAGGLMSYGPNQGDIDRRVAIYVDKILKGANPGDIPIEQPMTFEFVVNMKTAHELGITFPNEIMLQVTEIIQ